MTPAAIRYADAGVDRERARAVKRRIARLARRTFTGGVLAEIGRFGALYELNRRRWRQPVLVSSVDGVGTKLKVASMVGRHDGVAADLVHHCVNDIAVQGATPLFFLDYIASSRLEPDLLEQLFAGMSRACRALGVALIGGETAEMPGLYAPGDYDLVGFILGAVERDRILDGRRVRPGHRLIGLASTGLHTNGYSLARKLLFEVAGYQPDTFLPELNSKLGDKLLQPHQCYYLLMKPLLERGWLSAAAHITGGGLTENIPRVLPKRCAVEIHLDHWQVLPLFRLLERLGRLPAEEMLSTFNMGIGMVLIVPPAHVAKVERLLRRRRARFFHIGEVVRGRPQVHYRGSWQ
ncbi:MAG TPA: phosphoribosylformylglycinamidine cyclo-ligase [Candidatus Acidoferrales bacterium]|nr:phosphoribosylformylglycinamidine cyclo-ligase [Candidatus Acidoferrales bacterium]